MKRLVATGAALAALLLQACSGGGYGSVGPPDTSSGNGNPGGSTPPPPTPAATALFQLSAGVLPYPTDLYFAGSTDGTLNIQPPNPVMPNQAAINALDGFSTTAVIRENFSSALDASTLAGGVIIIPVLTDNYTKATVNVAGPPLTPGVDYSVGLGAEANGIGATILEIKPLHPLTASTCLPNGPAQCATGNGYLVVLTTGIKDANGNAAVPDKDYQTILGALAQGDPTCPSITDATLNAVCQLTGAQLQIVHGVTGLDPSKIALTFSFTTESTLDTLELMAATVKPATIQVFHPPGFTTAAIPGLGLPGHADLYVGVLAIPYYLSKSAPLTEYWHAPPFPLDTTSTFVTRYNPLPAPTATLQIPVFMSVPNGTAALGGTAPSGGWPVLVFQHSILRNREDLLALADSFADSGTVVVAIDLPLHGITDPNDPLYASGANPLYGMFGLPAGGSIERTFDLSTNGQIDPTGSHFINLTSLLTSRDNLREGVADLLVLTRTLPQLNPLVPGGINLSAVHFLGHSLGALEGGTFMALVPPTTISTATLAMVGGGIADLLRDSASFSPEINAGLAAQGVTPGTTLYEQFFRDAQTAVDAGDPINFIAYATAQHPMHLIQVVGAATPPSPAACVVRPNPDGCPDQVIPNSATQRLIVASGYLPAPASPLPFTQLGAAAPGPQVNPNGFRAVVNFISGYHGSIIDPSVSPAATQEMQLESLTFTGQPVPAVPFPATPPGTTILIGNPTVIEP